MSTPKKKENDKSQSKDRQRSMSTINLSPVKATSLRKHEIDPDVDSDDPIVWGFLLPLVPSPDTNQEIDHLNEQYSLSNLLKKLKKQT
ncbi:hypothetical protein TVAG_177570 [Trichomonas vaginalis G3]|uniref:Uncharacterized protein n=1 Tax=Trichomonas vaginalis (strain ATCC PRA-98 / G3) TaxID=412133 RepID=A2G8D7_TRIV3|nr:hypothetical protein TVAGG3_0017380 [Trichomonas vaginalis G3]EAX86581.1 hypothetical protein TVAG_177570 [Trichomonas vaginalis G3]KAI5539461.1 hypothetical protein TVAGG3_0017380 [Trichomonas vaginalis G3]|eukprot:XP_001299511.1 hypothetical protein [Trichomonas vaginalis G3]